MLKEIISRNGYCIEYVDYSKDFYMNDFCYRLIESINIEFRDKNESDIKLLFGHNLEHSERKSEEEVLSRHMIYEIGIYSIRDEIIYIFGISFYDIWNNLKKNIITEFNNFNEFIKWIIPLIYDREVYEEELSYFNNIYNKENNKIISLIEDRDDMKHRYLFMKNHQLTDNEYNYLKRHDNIIVDREYTSSLPNPVFIIDNDGKTIIRFNDYLEREHITVEQYYGMN